MHHNSPIDLDYLHSDTLGGVIAEGLTVLYDIKPEKPIEYLAKWLLSYRQTEAATIKFNEKIDSIKEGKLKEVRQQLLINTNQKKKLEQIQKELDIDAQYQERLRTFPYHEELLVDEFPEYLKKKFTLSSVYICHNVFQRLDIDIDLIDDETAFIDQKQQKLLKYIGSTKNSKYLIGQYLTLNATITYDILKPIAPLEDGTIPINHGAYVPDVIKDNRVFFHRFPQLGAYYAVPMLYESYLHEVLYQYYQDAFDQGLAATIKYNTEVQAIEEDKKQKYEQLQTELEENLTEEERTVLQQNYDAYVEGLVYPQEPTFIGLKEELIVCMDTLGMDTQINSRDQIYAQIKFFGDSFTSLEKQLLINDIKDQIEYSKFQQSDLLAQQAIYIEEQLVNHEDIKEQELDYAYIQETLKYDFLKLKFNEQSKQDILHLIRRRVIKYQNIFKAAFYLLGYQKENLTHENVLKWKEVKHLIDNDFLDKVFELSPQGPKQKSNVYATVARIEKLLERYDEDEVLAYNHGLGLICMFINQYCKLRRLDVDLRRHKLSEKKLQIQNAIQEASELQARREEALKLAIESYEPTEEAPEFDQEAYLAEWDSENPMPIIEAEPADDIDDDLE